MNDYQTQAATFIAAEPHETHAYLLRYPPDALLEEAGEQAGVFAKATRKRTAANLDRLRSEAGDLLWNIAAVCTCTGLSYAALTPQATVPEMKGARLRARIVYRVYVIADGLAMNAECAAAGKPESYKPSFFVPTLCRLLADVDNLLKENGLTRGECEAQNIEDLTARQEAQRAATL